MAVRYSLSMGRKRHGKRHRIIIDVVDSPEGRAAACDMLAMEIVKARKAAAIKGVRQSYRKKRID